MPSEERTSVEQLMKLLIYNTYTYKQPAIEQSIQARQTTNIPPLRV